MKTVQITYLATIAESGFRFDTRHTITEFGEIVLPAPSGLECNDGVLYGVRKDRLRYCDVTKSDWVNIAHPPTVRVIRRETALVLCGLFFRTI